MAKSSLRRKGFFQPTACSRRKSEQELKEGTQRKKLMMRDAGGMLEGGWRKAAYWLAHQGLIILKSSMNLAARGGMGVIPLTVN